MEIANLLNFLKRDFFLSFYVGKNKEACKEASKRQHDKLTHTHTHLGTSTVVQSICRAQA